MAEIEAQGGVLDEGALLFDVGAQDVPQGLVQEVGGRVVQGGFPSLVGMDPCREPGGRIGRKPVRDVQDELVFLPGRQDGQAPVGTDELTGVPNLSAAFRVEGGEVEDQLVAGLVLDLDLAPPGDADLSFEALVAHEFLDAVLLEDGPVPGLHLSGCPRAVLLSGQRGLEAGLVHLDAVLTTDEGGQVDGESVGVVEFEGGVSVEPVGPGNLLVQPLDALVEGAQKALLLFLHHFGDEGLLGAELGEEVAHLVGHDVHQFEQERAVEAEEAVAVAHGPAEDAADHIPGAGVGGELPVGDGEGHGTHVVCTDAQGHVHLVVSTGVGLPGGLAQVADQRLEDIRVIVALLALQDGGEALEAHAGVDVPGRKGLEGSVRLPHELHEDEVPDFDDLRVVLVDELGPRDGSPVGLASDVHMDFRAGATGTGLTHFPEVVLLVGLQDALGGHVLGPEVDGLLIEGQPILGVAFEDRDVQAVLVDAVAVCEQLPGPVDGLLLEVVAEGPVPEHLEHGVVVGVHTHLLEVVVLAADPQAFLGVRHPGGLGRPVAEEDVLERVHARIGEHQCRVVLQHHGSRRHDVVGLLAEEIEERAADRGGVHGVLVVALFTRLCWW